MEEHKEISACLRSLEVHTNQYLNTGYAVTKYFLSTIAGSDPLTFKEIDASVTVYADEVKGINMASTAEEAILNDGLVRLTLKQNEDKAEHIPSFLGNGQGKSAAKYLGNFCTYDSHNKTSANTRIYKAKEAFYSLGKL